MHMNLVNRVPVLVCFDPPVRYDCHQPKLENQKGKVNRDSLSPTSVARGHPDPRGQGRGEILVDRKAITKLIATIGVVNGLVV